MADTLCGRVLAGEFRLERLLGQGGMGAVYLAEQLSLSRRVAVKLLPPPSPLEGPDALERFRREAKAAARLQHPNIVQVFFFGEDDGQPFIAMELVPGESLGERLRREKTIPALEAARIGVEITRALAAAHAASIVHRDVKPDNIFLARDGAVKLGDFGLARDLTGGAISASGAVLGTPIYMAPEQCHGERVDGRADLYALGANLFHMVTGRPPYLADSIPGLMLCHVSSPVPSARTWAPGVPPALDALIARLLAKEPSERPATADEVRRLLTAASARGAPVAAGALSATPTVPLPSEPLARSVAGKGATPPAGIASQAVVSVPPPRGVDLRRALGIAILAGLVGGGILYQVLGGAAKGGPEPATGTPPPPVDAPETAPATVHAAAPAPATAPPATAPAATTPPAADDLSGLSDEFDSPTQLESWRQFWREEPGQANQLERFELDAGHTGWLLLAPYACVWFMEARGPFVFKPVTGDFVVTARLQVTNRAGTGAPNAQFSLGGILIRRPGAAGAATGRPNRENWVFHALGSGFTPGRMVTEAKTTTNSNSVMDSQEADTRAIDLQAARIGPHVLLLQRIDARWSVRYRYSRPDFPERLQVGLACYGDYQTVQSARNGGLDLNTAVLKTGHPDLLVRCDYVRFRRPAVPPALAGKALSANAAVSDDELLSFLADHADGR